MNPNHSDSGDEGMKTFTEKQLLKAINDHAPLQSLLYDLDLLPEQLKPMEFKWTQMLLICTTFMEQQAEIERLKKELNK